MYIYVCLCPANFNQRLLVFQMEGSRSQLYSNPANILKKIDKYTTIHPWGAHVRHAREQKLSGFRRLAWNHRAFSGFSTLVRRCVRSNDVLFYGLGSMSVSTEMAAGSAQTVHVFRMLLLFIFLVAAPEPAL